MTYWSIVRTGSRDEVEPGRSGFAHFFEHMMFRGTQKYPGPVYDEIVTSLGADSNAYTTDDYTAYHMTFAKEDLERVVEIESDRFQNLSYEKPAFQTEAGAVYGEYRKGITHPFSLLDEKLRDLAYDVHTYKHTTIGFEADIKAMPEAYEYSLSFFRRFYRPENVVILVVGDVAPPAAIDLVRKYYAGWEKGYVPPQIVPEPPQTAERKGDVQYPGKTLPILQISYQGDAFDSDNADYVAALLLVDLAFGETSEIYKKLVLDEQKVQALEAYVPMNRDSAAVRCHRDGQAGGGLGQSARRDLSHAGAFSNRSGRCGKTRPTQTPPQVRVSDGVGHSGQRRASAGSPHRAHRRHRVYGPIVRGPGSCHARRRDASGRQVLRASATDGDGLEGSGRMNMAIGNFVDGGFHGFGCRTGARIQRRAAAGGQRPDDQFPALVPRRLAERSAGQRRPGGI